MKGCNSSNRGNVNLIGKRRYLLLAYVNSILCYKV